MAKLLVWIAEQTNDNQCYNLIGRTKKEVQAQIDARPADDRDKYDEPKKVIIEYKDAFDLFDMLTNEGGGRHIHY